ncbi:hypothetical protein M9Y10_006840 [Tritrichomonas musculus]|uniref:Major facilitator superfamily transporter n=1 Tax=Tritrichomonas musculus TaxID=1915356 RepID=A0ABR2JGY9_9EUKA
MNVLDAPLIETEANNAWVPLNQRKKLSMGRILAIASCNLVPGLVWNIVFALLEPFVKSLGISSTVKTLLLLWGSFIGFVLGPVLGVISDGLTFKYGRRRIFVITGSVLVVISLLLMTYCYEIGTFLKPSRPDSYRKAVFIIAIMMVFTAGNIVQSPARVLCSDITPPTQQSLMSNICQVYNGVSSIFANLLGGFGVYKYTSLKQEQFLLIVCLSIAFLAMTISVISAVEEPLLVKPPKVNPFKQIWLAFRKMPKPFISTAPAFLLAFVATYQYQVAFSDFMGSEIMKGNNSEAAGEELNNLYQEGVSWSMMCNVMNNVIQLIYGFVNTKVCEVIGMKWAMVIGNFLIAFSLLLFLFVKNQFVYLLLTSLLGLGTVIYYAIPYAIVSIVIQTEELGNNLGLLNCFGVIGQQISNFAIGMGVGKLTNNSAGKKIGYSCIFGFLATVASFWVIQPQIGETYSLYKDDASDLNSIQEISTN